MKRRTTCYPSVTGPSLATALGVGNVGDRRKPLPTLHYQTIARDLGNITVCNDLGSHAYQLAIITISLLSFSFCWRHLRLPEDFYQESCCSVSHLPSVLWPIRFWMLTAARILQDGAAAINSVNTALLRIIYPKRFLGRVGWVLMHCCCCSIHRRRTNYSSIILSPSRHWLLQSISWSIAALWSGWCTYPQIIKVALADASINSVVCNERFYRIVGFFTWRYCSQGEPSLIIYRRDHCFMCDWYFCSPPVEQQFPLLPVDLICNRSSPCRSATFICSFTDKC